MLETSTLKDGMAWLMVGFGEAEAIANGVALYFKWAGEPMNWVGI
jgi:hypothetical protein